MPSLLLLHQAVKHRRPGVGTVAQGGTRAPLAPSGAVPFGRSRGDTGAELPLGYNRSAAYGAGEAAARLLPAPRFSRWT